MRSVSKTLRLGNVISCDISLLHVRTKPGGRNSPHPLLSMLQLSDVVWWRVFVRRGDVRAHPSPAETLHQTLFNTLLVRFRFSQSLVKPRKEPHKYHKVSKLVMMLTRNADETLRKDRRGRRGPQ